MSAEITPEKARSETIENLVDTANRYRVGTGAHTVVSNEINRREEIKKNWRKVFIAVCVGIIGLIFWYVKG